MILHKSCPICTSESLKGFAIDTKRKGPHISRVQCEECELVFANPMADSRELADYYTNYYDKDHYVAFDYCNLIVDHFGRIAKMDEDGIRKEVRFINKLGGVLSS